MQTICHFDSNLINNLNSYGINVIADAGRVKVKLPWPVERTPVEVRPLLRQVKERQAEILTYLQKDYKDYGKVIRLHPMRPSCQAAGHCLALTQETDCELYPVKLGWCRERL